MLVKYLSLLFLINTVTSECTSGRCRRPSRVNFQTSSSSTSSSRFKFSSGTQSLCSACGRSRHSFGCDTKITGGKEACRNEFPWAALLEIDGRSRCGGNLINDRWRKAVHCYVLLINYLLIGTFSRRGIVLKSRIQIKLESESHSVFIRKDIFLIFWQICFRRARHGGEGGRGTEIHRQKF